MIIISGAVTIHPSTRDQFVEIASDVAEASRREPGNLKYALAFDILDPTRLHISEEWSSQDDFETHLAAPHIVEFNEALAGLKVTDMSVVKHDSTAQERIL